MKMTRLRNVLSVVPVLLLFVTASRSLAQNAAITSLSQTNVVINSGAHCAFFVTASGGAPLTYQWAFNSVNIPGATTTALALTNLNTLSNGTYTVTVTASNLTTASSNAMLTVYNGQYQLQPTNLVMLRVGDGLANENGVTTGNTLYFDQY